MEMIAQADVKDHMNGNTCDRDNEYDMVLEDAGSQGAAAYLKYNVISSAEQQVDASCELGLASSSVSSSEHGEPQLPLMGSYSPYLGPEETTSIDESDNMNNSQQPKNFSQPSWLPSQGSIVSESTYGPQVDVNDRDGEEALPATTGDDLKNQGTSPPSFGSAPADHAVPPFTRSESLVSTLTPTLAQHFNKEKADNCDDSAVSSLTDTLALHFGSSWSFTGTIDDGSSSLPRIGQFAFIPQSARSAAKKRSRKSRKGSSKKWFWNESSGVDPHMIYPQEYEEEHPPQPQRTQRFPFTLGAPQMAESVSSRTRRSVLDEEWKEQEASGYEDRMEQGVIASSPRVSRFTMTGTIKQQFISGSSDYRPELHVEVTSTTQDGGGDTQNVQSTPDQSRSKNSTTSSYSKRRRGKNSSNNSTTTGLASVDATGNESCSMVAVANDSVSHYRMKKSPRKYRGRGNDSSNEDVEKPGSRNEEETAAVKRKDSTIDSLSSTSTSNDDDVDNDNPTNKGVGLLEYQSPFERKLLKCVGITLVIVFAIFLTLGSFWLAQRQEEKHSN